MSAFMDTVGMGRLRRGEPTRLSLKTFEGGVSDELVIGHHDLNKNSEKSPALLDIFSHCR